MKSWALTLATLLAVIVVATGRPDEALDSLMLSGELEPINDVVPRLLAEVIGGGPTAGAYAAESPATEDSPSPAPIQVQNVPPSAPPSAPSSSAAVATTAASLLTAAAVVMAVL